jgi:ACS family hexuronate transporter-like MFS transporter
MRASLVALVFVAVALNYIDRQVLALLKPGLETRFGWSEVDYAGFVTAFQFATLASLMIAGWLVDRFGVRIVYGAGVAAWSLAGMAHVFASSVLQFTGVRVVLAAAEAINTPAAMKTAALYLPAAERSFGVGIINSASNLGVIAASLSIPFLAAAFGWKAAFLVTGALGFVWLALWFAATRRLPPHAPTRKAAHQLWGDVLRDRSTWTIAGAKFLTDCVWVFMLSWLPDFFVKNFGMNMTEFSWPLALIYSLAALGAIFSGALFPLLRMRGLNYGQARKGAMLGFALLALVIPLAPLVTNAWLAALLIGLGLFAHQGFSTNIFALATDIVPADRLASAISIGAVAANLSGMLIAAIAGIMLHRGFGYQPLFLACGLAYLVGTAWVALMQSRITPAVEEG